MCSTLGSSLTLPEMTMTVHYLKPHQVCSCCEEEMPKAPSVVLPNGTRVVPQHYLQFEQSLLSIREIINDIEVGPLTPIFVDEDTQGMYIQVGLIGRENYDRGQDIRPSKLVYGRKWRIDSNTPSSEIVQTAFLAVKKAREHEMRELLTLKDAQSGKISAPFSTHQDLPVMANNRDLLDVGGVAVAADLSTIKEVLAYVRFGEREIHLVDSVVRQQHILLDFALGAAPLARQREKDLQEFNDWTFSIIIESFNPSHFLYALMDKFIAHSDLMIAEAFSYKGFKRFSRNNDPRQIASLSIALRPYERDMAKEEFAPRFRELNYQTDASRVPSLGEGPLAEKNRAIIFSVDNLLGHLPPDLFSEENDPFLSVRKS